MKKPPRMFCGGFDIYGADLDLKSLKGALSSHLNLLKIVGDFRLTPFRLSDRILLLATPIYILLMLLSSGCATQQTAVPVRVQVSVPCLTQDQVPVKPALTADADLLKLSDGDLIIVVASERISLKSYANLADAAIQACVKQ